MGSFMVIVLALIAATAPLRTQDATATDIVVRRVGAARRWCRCS